MNHIAKAKVIISIGLKMKIDFSTLINIHSFVINLIASEIGCNNPIIPVLLGPFRDCKYLRIFRSNKVRKATLTRIHIIQRQPPISFNYFTFVVAF